jgi:hypothetical protein
MIIIVDHDEVSQLEMAGSTSRFTGNALHCTSIAEEAEGVIVDELKARFVEFGCSMSLRNGKTNRICETLAKRTRGDFDTWCILRFWMSGSNAINVLVTDTSR